MIRRYALPAGLTLAVAWVLLLTFLIHGRPEAGAADPAALAAAYRSAVAARDEEAVKRLLSEPPDGAARALIDRDACGRLTAVRPVADDDRRFLELAGTGGRTCGRVPIAEHGGRWYIDPWAAPVRWSGGPLRARRSARRANDRRGGSVAPTPAVVRGVSCGCCATAIR